MTGDECLQQLVDTSDPSKDKISVGLTDRSRYNVSGFSACVI